MNLRKKLSDRDFRIMHRFMRLVDRVHPYVPAHAASFAIQSGMTVVDYGCGPGRYTVEFARLVGEGGKVYAVDLIDIAIQEAKKRVQRDDIRNVEFKLAQGYDSGISQGVADLICAVDMFHHVEPAPFLIEMERIAKPDGALIVSGGHMPKRRVMEAVTASGLWGIAEEGNGYLKFKKNGPERNIASLGPLSNP